MNDTYTQLILDFELTALTYSQEPTTFPPQSTTRQSIYQAEASSHTSNVVHLSQARNMKESIQRQLDEQALMAHIRARVAHLQA